MYDALLLFSSFLICYSFVGIFCFFLVGEKNDNKFKTFSLSLALIPTALYLIGLGLWLLEIDSVIPFSLMIFSPFAIVLFFIVLEFII